jgi:hypothetical protein
MGMISVYGSCRYHHMDYMYASGDEQCYLKK